MLDYQNKQNEAAESPAFINDEHDAAEFNSMARELKNAVTDLGGDLTALPDYATETIYQLAKSIIAGSGYIYTPFTEASGNILFKNAGASGNSIPSLTAITGKIVSYKSTLEQLATTPTYINWISGNSYELKNIDGTSLQPGQIKAGVIVSFYFDGADFILVATVDPVAGGVFLNSIGFGKGLDANWETKPDNLFQNRMGEYTSLQTTLSDFFYDVIGHGFRTEEILGSTMEESFSALPDTISVAGCIGYTSDGYVVGIGGTGSSGETHSAVKAPSGSVSQNDITAAAYFPTSVINTSSGKKLFYSDTNLGLTGNQILESDDNGVTYSVSHTGGLSPVVAGATRFSDGTLCFTQWSSNSSNAKPKTLYTIDEGDNWLEGVEIPNSDAGQQVTVGILHNTFMKHSDGTIFFAAIGDLTEFWSILRSATSIDGAFTEVSPILSGVNNEQVNCSYMDERTDTMYVGIQDLVANTINISKSSDKGVTWDVVYSSATTTTTESILKIVKTPEGILYAITRGSATFNHGIIRSIDGGENWTVIEDNSTLIRDMVYTPYDASLYMVKDNSADSKGFIVETIAVEKDYATGTGTPIKQRFYNGVVDFFVGGVTTIGAKVQWGLGVLSLAKNYIGILRNSDAPIAPSQAPNGSLYRNSDDNDRLYSKELDGSNRPVGAGVSGLYIPTLSNLFNVNIITINPARWSRSGDDITTYGSFVVNPLNAIDGSMTLRMSLADATSFTGSNQSAGGAWTSAGHDVGGRCYNNTGTEVTITIKVSTTIDPTDPRTLSYNYTYRSTT